MPENYTVKDIYQGGYSSLSPTYGDIFTGYRTNAGNFGTTTDGRTANILQSLSDQISKGLKTIEVGSISPEVFESIPNQQLKEVKRLSKLTGVDVTVHAPVVEPSGMTQQGFSESGRNAIERQINQFVERAHEMSSKGNIPVTLHSSAMLPGEIAEKGKKPEETFIINSETGSLHRLPIKTRAFPGEEEANVSKEIAKINEEQWSQGIRSLSYYADMGEEAIRRSGFLARGAEAEEKAGKELYPEEKSAQSSFNMGVSVLNDSYRQLKDLFETANKYGSHTDKQVLGQFKEKIEENAKKIQENPRQKENVYLMADIIKEGVKAFNKIETSPQIFKPLNDFAQEKTTETFSNVALNAYKKFKDKAPIISVENPPAGGAFSTGKELKELIEKSRKKFVEKAMKPKDQGGFGLSEATAREKAEKLLGVTWDVGHINMMKKFGYDDKEIIKETKKVAPLVKHIHLSDNFGFEHTELPMGMGNVPIKEMMQKLPEKDIKKIVEAISFYQHFKTPAVTATLEAFGSPVYSMEMAPYWNQTLGYQQGYVGGFEGAWIPQTNYETFGAGFMQLPKELGGQRPGAQGSRMSGTPME
ncbi:MAG: hypothetical protein KKF48_01710 [Nanoarchaeota archaeon]|nr:hypothetical protein [Nanoarchaeota archaeon]MBU1027737.1 hypothetical protein [Nanoarchaeota archaeon]